LPDDALLPGGLDKRLPVPPLREMFWSWLGAFLGERIKPRLACCGPHHASCHSWLHFEMPLCIDRAR
jgi:hypothetical protein